MVLGHQNLVLEQERECKVSKITPSNEETGRLSVLGKLRREKKPAEKEPVEDIEEKLVLESREKTM